MSLDRIRIVLVETSHPGNIGASARAMKTMGLEQLRLVRPKFFPHAEATAMASGADDLLTRAALFDTLAAAVADCVCVVGTTARQRTLNWPTFDPRDSASRAIDCTSSGPVAVVFGRERTGLSNAELDHCQWLLHIAANPDYGSLNLAMAVQLVGYELRVAADAGGPGRPVRTLAPAEEMERLYEHLNRVMLATEFLDPEHPRYLMRRMRLLINRAEPDQNEVNILRGFLASIERGAGYNRKDD